jgi:hypothetical protein
MAMGFLTHQEKENFEKFGYVIVKSGLEDTQLLVDAQKSFRKILERSESGEYPYFRVYDDYFSKVINIAGIEMPFHPNIINKNIVKCLNTSNMVQGAKDIIGEGGLKLDLSRYHTTREDFGHIGDWHRDKDFGDNKCLQVSIFLFDEQGLEFIPKSHMEKDSRIEEKIRKYSSDKLERAIHPKCKAGNILFFHPAILHRGICSSFRANVHFRFSLDVNYKSSEFNNTVGFNQDWVDVLSNKNSIVTDSKIKKYTKPSGIFFLFKKSLRTFVHYVFFLFPYNFILFRKLHIHPNLKLRKIFYKNL